MPAGRQKWHCGSSWVLSHPNQQVGISKLATRDTSPTLCKTVPPGRGQVFRYISLWLSFSFKPQQSLSISFAETGWPLQTELIDWLGWLANELKRYRSAQTVLIVLWELVVRSQILMLAYWILVLPEPFLLPIASPFVHINKNLFLILKYLEYTSWGNFRVFPL